MLNRLLSLMLLKGNERNGIPFSKGLEEQTGFGMKKWLIVLSLENNFLNSLRDENNEPIYTYNNEYMQYFVRRSRKGGSCATLNQYCETIISLERYIF